MATQSNGFRNNHISQTLASISLLKFWFKTRNNDFYLKKCVQLAESIKPYYKLLHSEINGVPVHVKKEGMIYDEGILKMVIKERIHAYSSNTALTDIVWRSDDLSDLDALGDESRNAKITQLHLAVGKRFRQQQILRLKKEENIHIIKSVRYSKRPLHYYYNTRCAIIACILPRA